MTASFSTNSNASALPDAWIRAWNAHRLDDIMSLYAKHVTLVSPTAAKLLDDPTGEVRGKPALRAYFQKGLDAYPNLHFELLDTLWGVRSVVLYFVNQKGTKTAEYMEFDPVGKISRVIANYSG